MEKQINILLVDDHRMFADSLKNLLNTESGFCVVDTANDAKGALGCCHDYPQLDIILMDIHFPQGNPNGLELARQIKGIYPEIKVLVCSGHHEIEYIRLARKLGANGYIKKDASGAETVHAIKEVIKGNEVWPLTGLSIDPGWEKPTPTEMDVLKYVARGLQTDQIGIELAMLVRTVSAHRRNIKLKYNLKTRGDLILFAEKCMGLYGIEPDPQLPAELDGHFKKFKRDTGIAVEFDGDTTDFNNATNKVIARVVEEGLKNIKQHASTSKVSIQLDDLNSSRITLTICDDGKGFDVNRLNGLKKGIYGLKRILAAIGGELVITSSPDGGTSVIATLRRTTRH
jgi:DNA-binding NarL/FixJ family response regulator